MTSKIRTILALSALLALGAALPAAHAASPYRVPVHFAYTNDCGGGNSWFVVGSHPDVGSWNPLQAIKLRWTDGNVWQGDVGIQAGTELEYKFIKRSTAADQIGNSKNVEWMEGDDLSLTVPAEPPAPNPGKRVVFLCDWPEPVLLRYAMMASSDPDAIVGEWQNATMTKTGNGRYEIDGVGEAGEWMRFVVYHPLDGQPEDKWWWYHFRPADDIEEGDFCTPPRRLLRPRWPDLQLRTARGALRLPHRNPRHRQL